MNGFKPHGPIDATPTEKRETGTSGSRELWMLKESESHLIIGKAPLEVRSAIRLSQMMLIADRLRLDL